MGEKWTTVLPSKIDVDFFYSVVGKPRVLFHLAMPTSPQIGTVDKAKWGVKINFRGGGV